MSHSNEHDPMHKDLDSVEKGDGFSNEYLLKGTRIGPIALIMASLGYSIPSQMPQMFNGLWEEYGDHIELSVGPLKRFVDASGITIISSPRDVSFIFTHDQDSPSGGTFTKDNALFAALAESFIPQSLFVTTGGEYTEDKKMLAPHFTRESIERYRAVTKKAAGDLVDLPEGEYDLMPKIDEYTINTLVSIMFGTDALDEGEIESTVNLLKGSIPFVLKRVGLRKFLPENMTPGFRQYKMYNNAVEKMMTNLVDKKIQTRNDGVPHNEPCLLDVLIDKYIEGGIPFEKVIFQAKGFLEGAYDALSASISTITYELLAAKQKSTGIEEGQMNSVLRKWTPVWMSVRRATEDTELPSGYKVKGNTLIVLNLLAAHHHPEMEDLQKGFEFGGGIHTCLGQNLARMIIQESISKILENDFELIREAQPIYTATNAPDKIIVRK